MITGTHRVSKRHEMSSFQLPVWLAYLPVFLVSLWFGITCGIAVFAKEVKIIPPPIAALLSGIISTAPIDNNPYYDPSKDWQKMRKEDRWAYFHPENQIMSAAKWIGDISLRGFVFVLVGLLSPAVFLNVIFKSLFWSARKLCGVSPKSEKNLVIQKICFMIIVLSFCIASLNTLGFSVILIGKILSVYQSCLTNILATCWIAGCAFAILWWSRSRGIKTDPDGKYAKVTQGIGIFLLIFFNLIGLLNYFDGTIEAFFVFSVGGSILAIGLIIEPYTIEREKITEK